MTDDEIMQHQMTLDKLISDNVDNMLHVAEQVVRKISPNAKLLVSCDKKGRSTFVGIYDLPLRLNDRHNFHAHAQFAPQLIGERCLYKDEFENSLKRKIEFDCWFSAYRQLLALKTIQ